MKKNEKYVLYITINIIETLFFRERDREKKEKGIQLES